MSATEVIKTAAAIDAHPRGTASNALPVDMGLPPFRERLGELIPLIDFVPGAGPPMIFIVGPWTLLALMLTGPFLLLVTFVLAVGILVVLAAAILAPLYLLAARLARSREEAHLYDNESHPDRTTISHTKETYE